MFRPAAPASLQANKANAAKEVFRLEFRQVYSVEADLQEFEKWKRSEQTAADDPSNQYWCELRDLRDRGIESRRVRVIDFPISDYLRYEIDFYRGSSEQGEEILFIERAPTIDCMQSTAVTQDYWLFDRSTVLLWKYDKRGQRDGQDEATNPVSVAPYRELRDCLVRHALPMSEFMARYPDSFALRPAS